MTSTKPWGVIVLIGHIESWKMTLVKEFLNTLGFGGKVVTDEIAFKKYARINNVERLNTSYKPEIVRDFVEIQRGEKARPHFLVLDDCLYDARWTRDPYMNALFKEADKLQSLLLINMPYAIGIPAVLRAGIDYICIFRENYVPSRTKLYDMYCKTLLTKEQFHAAMNWVGANEYSCLVLDRSRKEERVCWYKATRSVSRLEHWLNTEVIQYKDGATEEANDTAEQI